MKIQRTQNASRNMLFSGALKIYQIIVPFLMRTAMIHYMGIQYLGLNTLFTSILQVLNLTELGVGSAMVYSMYKPIADDDTDSICSLMKLYRLYYRIIGSVIAVVGLAISPIIPYLIKSDLPSELNIYVLYFLNLAATVFTYWLFAYRNSLFQAHQRIDVTSKIGLVMNTVKFLIQFLVIAFLQDYYVYIIVSLLTQISSNIITAIISKKMYPEYNPKGEMDKSTSKKINNRIRDLFTSKVGGVILNSADSVVISAFLGLTALAIYQNYYFIITAIIGIVAIIFDSVTAGIGNSIIIESKEKNYHDFEKFDLIITWIACFCTCCLLCLFQPFMELWVGTELMLDYKAVICLCIYYFIYELNHLFNTYKDAAGIWHSDRYRPLITSVLNLALNLLLVNNLGLYGVLLSTVVSTLLVGMPWLLHNLFTNVFSNNHLRTFLVKQGKYILCSLISVVCVLAGSFITVNAVIRLLINFVICFIIPNCAFYLAFRKTEEFNGCVLLVEKIIHGKLKFNRSIRKR